MSATVVVTGAFSYTGKYTARLLLERGYRVRTLTHHPERPDPFGKQVEVFPYNFDRPAELRRSLEGARALINTYWVRFPRGGSTFESAVHNTRTLIRSAKEAGVERIVHVSIANPSLESPLGYYKGKAETERAVTDSALSYAILRPTVIFGAEDILINNIAWFVRHFPVFGIPGDGRHGIRPIYVQDMARLLADAVDERDSSIRNAVGPETFRFDELVKLIATGVGRPAHLVPMPIGVAYVATLITGLLLGDVVLTWEEYQGLISNLLAPDGPATGQIRLSQWLMENGSSIGRNYASEVARHYLTINPVTQGSRS